VIYRHRERFRQSSRMMEKRMVKKCTARCINGCQLAGKGNDEQKMDIYSKHKKLLLLKHRIRRPNIEKNPSHFQHHNQCPMSVKYLSARRLSNKLATMYKCLIVAALSLLLVVAMGEKVAEHPAENTDGPSERSMNEIPTTTHLNYSQFSTGRFWVNTRLFNF